MEKRKSLSCSFPDQDPGLCSWSQTADFSYQLAVFSCCVFDSLVTKEPFIPLGSSSTPFSPPGLCSALSRVNSIRAAVIPGVVHGDLSVDSLVSDTCKHRFAGFPLVRPHFHADLPLFSLSFLAFTFLALSALYFFFPPSCSVFFLSASSGTVDCCSSFT